MAWKRRVIDRMERCYCVGSASICGQDVIYAASEEKGGAFYTYSVTECGREVIWEHGGGTMAVVPVPGEADTLYAIRNFFPGFNAADAQVVCCRKKEDKWELIPVLDLPYLHRFDIFQVEDKRVFLGSTLCTSKKEKEDWSDPGKVYVGYLEEDVTSGFKVEVLAEGLVKNHGYWRGEYQGQQAGYIASQNGVFAFVPGKTTDNSRWERVWNHPVSEAAFFDLDGCGERELIAIEPFHGKELNIYKLIGGKYEQVYTYPSPAEFLHAIWVGEFSGKPVVICGARRLNKELFMVTYENGGYVTNIIDEGVGSANVCVFYSGERPYILSADHGRGDIALYSED